MQCRALPATHPAHLSHPKSETAALCLVGRQRHLHHRMGVLSATEKRLEQRCCFFQSMQCTLCALATREEASSNTMWSVRICPWERCQRKKRRVFSWVTSLIEEIRQSQRLSNFTLIKRHKGSRHGDDGRTRNETKIVAVRSPSDWHEC